MRPSALHLIALSTVASFSNACRTTGASDGSTAAANASSREGGICAAGPAVAPAQADSIASRYYADGEIHVINLQMAAADWERLRQEEPPRRCEVVPGFDYTKFPGVMTVDGYEVGSITVKKKSICGSLSSVKPGLKVKKDKRDGKKTFFATGEAVTDAILNNSVQDKAYERQCFSYKLMRDHGYVAPRCNYTTLCVNHQSKGVYINVEAPAKSYIAHSFPDPKAQQPLIEGDFTGNGDGRHSDFYQDRPDSPWDLHEGSEDTFKASFASPAYQQMVRVLDNFDPEVLQGPAPKPVSQAAIDALGAWVDLPRFRQYYLWETLLLDNDGANNNRNNFYMYLRPDNNRWQFLPYGMDQTLLQFPETPFRGLRLANAYLSIPALRAGLAKDFTALHNSIDHDKYKAEALAMGARLKPLLPADEAAIFDKELDTMTYQFWRSWQRDPVRLFGAD